MKRLITPASILFSFLMVIVFFLLGIYVSKLVGADKNQMLAGGAIVLFYGLVSSGIAFILSLFIAYKVNQNTLINFNKALGVLFFLLVSITAYNYITREKKEDPATGYPNKTTSPVNNNITTIAYQAAENPDLSQHTSDASMGIGMFKADFYEKNKSAMWY
ncbi:MAG: hypothetical protein WBP08_05095 [Saprospiraceae bacterium]